MTSRAVGGFTNNKKYNFAKSPRGNRLRTNRIADCVNFIVISVRYDNKIMRTNANYHKSVGLKKKWTQLLRITIVRA